jgi:ferredoxin
MRPVGMRIEVDHEVCTGHGRCWSLAPDVYDADDDGYCAVEVIDVPAELEERARRGATNCPERAITIVVD